MTALIVRLAEKLWSAFPASDKTRCHCGTQLHGRVLDTDSHEAGWETDEGRKWIYVICPKCNYKMALWKMGIPWDFDFRGI